MANAAIIKIGQLHFQNVVVTSLVPRLIVTLLHLVSQFDHHNVYACVCVIYVEESVQTLS